MQGFRIQLQEFLTVLSIPTSRIVRTKTLLVICVPVNTRWCNGNTRVFGTLVQGSNPCRVVLVLLAWGLPFDRFRWSLLCDTGIPTPFLKRD